MPPRRPTHRKSPPQMWEALPSIVQLWIARALVDLRGHRQFIANGRLADDALARVTGLEMWLDSDSDMFSEKAALAGLRQWAQSIERKAAARRFPSPLSNNIQILAQRIGLNEVDRHILALTVLMATEPLLSEATDYLGSFNSHRLFRCFSTLLGVSTSEIAQALRPDGLLVSSSLVELSSETTTLSMKCQPLSMAFASQITTFVCNPIELLSNVVGAGGRAHLALTDFGHIQLALNVIQPLLRSALAGRRTGVNVFIYGRPGTGKTELARSLAASLEAPLYEISAEGRDGTPLSGRARLQSLRAAQTILGSSKSLLLFDEAEDLFGDDNSLPFLPRASSTTENKAWINKALESNRVPVIWLSNTGTGLDPAFVRRFDLVLELPIPPRDSRFRIIEGLCGDLVPEESIRRMAQADALAPAVVARAAGVLRLVRSDLSVPLVPAALEMLVASTLEAQGNPSLDASTQCHSDQFDPRFANASADLLAIAQGLSHAKQGRICLYGPPGTGKTAFGRWLAKQLQQPLIAKMASALLSSYVGDSEKKVAKAFKEAHQRGAVLMMDEVDSFLQDRRNARHTWEVTLVNEMLTQIEAFTGIFVASTNLVQGLDKASLRRFDIKVEFGYLRPEQSVALLDAYCSKLGLAPPDDPTRRQLSTLQALTPGDYAAVARRHHLQRVPEAASFVASLEAECSLKEGITRKIGY